MAMSRKHYNETAAILADAQQQLDAGTDPREVVNSITTGLSHMFKADNARFDREKFAAAAKLHRV